MKKLIAMIGVGAALCLAPSCKKSNMIPRDLKATDETVLRDPGVQPPAVDANTSMYVMLASMPCANPEKEYTSLMLDIQNVKVFNAASGWQELKTITSGWDLVYMQQGSQPGWNITDRTIVNAGAITQVAVTFGDNNKLVVNNQLASCFKVATHEIVIDVRGDVQKGAVNELKLGIDICGHISVQQGTDGSKCYVLKPDIQFQQITQKMAK